MGCTRNPNRYNFTENACLSPSPASRPFSKPQAFPLRLGAGACAHHGGSALRIDCRLFFAGNFPAANLRQQRQPDPGRTARPGSHRYDPQRPETRDRHQLHSGFPQLRHPLPSPPAVGCHPFGQRNRQCAPLSAQLAETQWNRPGLPDIQRQYRPRPGAGPARHDRLAQRSDHPRRALEQTAPASAAKFRQHAPSGQRDSPGPGAVEPAQRERHVRGALLGARRPRWEQPHPVRHHPHHRSEMVQQQFHHGRGPLRLRHLR